MTDAAAMKDVTVQGDVLTTTGERPSRSDFRPVTCFLPTERQLELFR